MRYKAAAVLAALKVVFLAVWVFTGFDFRASQVSAQTENHVQVRPVQEPAGEALKKTETGYAEEKGLLAAINRRQAELDAREENIKAREEKLEALKKDIEDKLAETNKARREIGDITVKMEEKNNERISKVVKIYESMSPEEAAPRMERLDDETAVSILAFMSPKKAARIMAAMDVDKSARLSLAL
ncbi:MAG: hypothetical protein AAB307_04535, partial [Deltaproteobacteria bacterium]